MTIENTSLLTAEQIAHATAAGKAWGEVEVECWCDQHGDMSRAPEWTCGTWSGHNPLGCPSESEAAREYESVLDAAARDVWEAARE